MKYQTAEATSRGIYSNWTLGISSHIKPHGKVYLTCIRLLFSHIYMLRFRVYLPRSTVHFHFILSRFINLHLLCVLITMPCYDFCLTKTNILSSIQSIRSDLSRSQFICKKDNKKKRWFLYYEQRIQLL